jgi:hypothetical protein
MDPEFRRIADLVAQAASTPAYIPPNPTHRSNDLLEGISGRLANHEEVLSKLVELGRLEHDARLEDEITARRRFRVMLVLGVLTLLAAIASVVVTAIAA